MNERKGEGASEEYRAELGEFHSVGVTMLSQQRCSEYHNS